MYVCRFENKIYEETKESDLCNYVCTMNRKNGFSQFSHYFENFCLTIQLQHFLKVRQVRSPIVDVLSVRFPRNFCDFFNIPIWLNCNLLDVIEVITVLEIICNNNGRGRRNDLIRIFQLSQLPFNVGTRI